MYIWMMLATFIVMLAAFNLSPRADLHRVRQTPLAEAAITKFLVQHDAAVKYAKSKLERFHNNPTSVLELASGSLTGCADGEGDLCNFLPIGYKYEENLYYSGVYCLNIAEYTTETNAETGEFVQTISKYEGVELASCSDTPHRVVYVITYGRVPERWKNVSTNRILADYYNAMHSKIAVGSSCGIVVPKNSYSNTGNSEIEGSEEGVEESFEQKDVRNPLNSNYVISGIDVQNNSIPKYFLDHEANFNTKCTTEIDGAFPCIMYVTAL